MKEKLGNGNGKLDHKIVSKIEKASLIEKVEAYFNTLNHMIIACVTVYITWICYNSGYSRRTTHVLLCTLGYQLLMAEAILTLYASNSWTTLHTKVTKTRLHYVLQTVGSGFSIAGVVVEYLPRGSRFSRIHEMTGIISIGFLCVSMLNGVSALWGNQLRSYVRPVYLKLFHNFIGTTCFVSGIVAIIYSFDLRWFVNRSTPEIILFLKIFCSVTIIMSLFGALKSGYLQIKGVARSIKE